MNILTSKEFSEFLKKEMQVHFPESKIEVTPVVSDSDFVPRVTVFKDNIIIGKPSYELYYDVAITHNKCILFDFISSMIGMGKGKLLDKHNKK